MKQVEKTGSDNVFKIDRSSGFDDHDPSPVYQLLKQMEELASRHREVEHRSKVRKRMLGLTSHDLMTPINAISGYLDLMKLCLNTDADPAQISRYRTQIKNGVNDLVNIVHQLREMSNIEDEDELDLPLDVDLNWVARDVCDVMEGAAIAKDHDLTCTSMSTPAYVTADLSRLKRILYNLINNSIKYTPRGGKIGVKVQASDDSARVIVEDNGVGIPSDDFTNIFKANNRLHLSGTENESASGLGLYISAHFATLMKGHITLESKVEEGSRFTLHLPLSGSYKYNFG